MCIVYSFKTLMMPFRYKATSQSALTSVSLGDLEDSELSEWT